MVYDLDKVGEDQIRHDEKIKGIIREAAEQKRDVWRAIGDMRKEGRGLIVKISFVMGFISFVGVFFTVLIQIYLKIPSP